MYQRYALMTGMCILLGCTANQPANNQPATNPSVKKQSVVKTKDPIATLDGNVAIDFSPDGKWLAIGAELVDTSTWKVVAMLEERVSDKNPRSKNHWGYTSASFSPDSKKLALGDQDGTLRLLDVPAMTMSHEVLAHGARITGIGFANDNETMVTTSIDDFIRIRIWNYQTNKELFRSDSDTKTPKDPNGSVVDIVSGVDVFALSPNREMFAVADVMSKIVIGRVQDGKILKEFKGPNGDKVEMDSLAFTPDSSKLLIGVTPNVYVYNLNGEPTSVQIKTQANSSTIRVKTIDDSGTIAMWYEDTASKSPVVEFFDSSRSKSLGGFVPHSARGAYWACSRDGKFIAMVGRGGPIRVWDVKEAMQELSPLETSASE